MIYNNIGKLENNERKRHENECHFTGSLWEKAAIQATMERVSFTEVVRRALIAYLGKSDMKETAQSRGKGK